MYSSNSPTKNVREYFEVTVPEPRVVVTIDSTVPSSSPICFGSPVTVAATRTKLGVSRKNSNEEAVRLIQINGELICGSLISGNLKRKYFSIQFQGLTLVMHNKLDKTTLVTELIIHYIKLNYSG